MPHIVIYLVFNSSYWYIMASIIAYLVLYQAYCILYKYATYSQCKDAPSLIATLVFMVICPLLPISIPMTIHAFIKARNRIQYA